MKKQYYLRLEFRYSFKKFFGEDEDDYEEVNVKEKLHSELFDEQSDCIDFGNKLIEQNQWIEQYPGHVGRRLNKRLGRPLIAPSLKNGTDIYISVESLNVSTFDEMDEVLNKFKVNEINEKIKV